MVYFIALLLPVLLVIVDQIIKAWAVHALKGGTIIPIINGFLQFEYLENTGAAFGFFDGNKVFLIGVTSVAIAAAIAALALKKIKGNGIMLAVSLIIGGGLGNLVDRIFNGYVVDYIHLVKPIDFAVFNFADSCVVCGAILLVLSMILPEIKAKLKKPDKEGQRDE